MKLKELFQSLVRHGYKVEIYFNSEDLYPVFGFKINNIDSEVLVEDNWSLYFSIVDEINNVFLY